MTDSVIHAQLVLFADALQIVALTAGGCATSFSSAPENLAPLLKERLIDTQDSQISSVSFQLLMNLFVELMPYYSLNNIFRQLDELII